MTRVFELLLILICIGLACGLVMWVSTKDNNEKKP